MDQTRALDRHGLVMAVWLSLGFVAVALFKYGLGQGGAPFILSGFAVVIAAFVGHVIVNAVYRTAFSPGELALGLAVYAAALAAFGLATLLAEELREGAVLSLSIGFIALVIVVVFYMITHGGVRRAFEAFNVIRDFRPRP